MLTNMVNMVIMVFQTFCSIERHSAEAYGVRMVGEGLTYRERLYYRVLCPECDKDLVVGSLATH